MKIKINENEKWKMEFFISIDTIVINTFIQS